MRYPLQTIYLYLGIFANVFLCASKNRDVQGSVLDHLHPVILVPGNGGSQLEARLNRSSTAHWWCSKTSDWYDLWLNINEMLTFMVDCWAENVALVYDPDTKTTSNAPGWHRGLHPT